MEDYPSAVKFISKVAEMDSVSTRNSPSFNLQRGELLTVELYSPPLNGLSQVDFELAININRMSFDEYFLIPISDLTNYMREVQKVRFAR